jgi:hypothetical protein
MSKRYLTGLTIALFAGCTVSNPDSQMVPDLAAGVPDLQQPGPPDSHVPPPPTDFSGVVVDLTIAAADLALAMDALPPPDLVGDVDMTKPVCGVAGLPCCPGGKCGAGALCANNACVVCGNAGTPCCPGQTCVDKATICGGGLCVTCGKPGGPCCAANDCGGGDCCVNGQCVAAGQGCGGQLGACAMGKCANCGGVGQPCCFGLCIGNGLLCQNNACVRCGDAGLPCCAGNTCPGGNARCTNNLCTACGKPGSPCCEGNTCSQGCCGVSQGQLGCIAVGSPCPAGDLCLMNNQCAGCGAVGLPCCQNNGCPMGVACVNNLCGTARSCAALHASDPKLASGPYTIDPDGAGPGQPFTAYCDMTNDGGGWTLAMKVDGQNKTFLFGAQAWSDMSTSGAPDLTAAEAKLAPFNSLPFTAVRLVVRDAMADRAAVITPAGLPPGATLRSVFQSGVYYPTALKRPGWLALYASGSLQTMCGREGLNVMANVGHTLRLGIVGNQENNCDTCDSSIGIGTEAYASGNDAIAQWDDSGAGGRMTRSFAFVWIR